MGRILSVCVCVCVVYTVFADDYFISFFFVWQVPRGSSSDGPPEIITAYPNLGVLPIISFFGFLFLFLFFCFGTKHNLLIETADKEKCNNRSELKKKRCSYVRLLYDVGTSRRTNISSSRNMMTNMCLEN